MLKKTLFGLVAAGSGFTLAPGCGEPSCFDTATCPVPAQGGGAGAGAGDTVGGSGGQPMNLGLGEACTANEQCISMVCSGGTCCTEECDLCNACDSSGVCAPVSDGTSVPECAGAACVTGACNFLEPVWGKSFGGANEDASLAVDAVSDGALLSVTIGGVGEPVSLGGSASWGVGTVRYDSDGNHSWTHWATLDGAGAPFVAANGHGVSADGDVAVVGRFLGQLNFDGAESFTSEETSFAFLVNQNGLFQWSVTAEAALTDAVIVQDRVFVAGTVAGQETVGAKQLTASDARDPFIVELNALDGVPLTTGPPNFPVPGQEAEATLAAASDGLVMVNSATVAKYGLTLAMEWQASMAEGRLSEVVVTTTGDVYVAGDYFDSGSFQGTPYTNRGSSDVIVIKIGSGGALEWLQPIGTANQDLVSGLAVTADGVVVSLSTSSSNTLSIGDDAFPVSAGSVLVKLDGAGNGVYAENPTAGVADILDIAPRPDGGVYVIGSFEGMATVNGSSFSSSGMADAFIVAAGP